MKSMFLVLAASCVLAACGGGSEDTKDASKADAQQLAAAPKTCEAGMTLSGDTCVHQATRPAPGQPLESK